MQMSNAAGTWTGASSAPQVVTYPSSGTPVGGFHGPLGQPVKVSEVVLTHRMVELARQWHECERQMAETRGLSAQRVVGENCYATYVQPSVSGVGSVAPVVHRA